LVPRWARQAPVRCSAASVALWVAILSVIRYRNVTIIVTDSKHWVGVVSKGSASLGNVG